MFLVLFSLGCHAPHAGVLPSSVEQLVLVTVVQRDPLLTAAPPDATAPVGSLPAASWSIARTWRWPVQGVLTSGFGPRGGRIHEGIDLAAPAGTPVLAASEGTVVRAGTLGTLGMMVELQHGERSTSRYGHLSAIHVAPGAHVDAGQPIGEVGATGRATGPHLHWELREDGVPVDPRRVMQRAWDVTP